MLEQIAGKGARRAVIEQNDHQRRAGASALRAANCKSLDLFPHDAEFFHQFIDAHIIYEGFQTPLKRASGFPGIPMRRWPRTHSKAGHRTYQPYGTDFILMIALADRNFGTVGAIR
jgi:hypothetical protein